MAVNVFMSQFIQMADSFRNEVKGSLYEWAFESLVHMIHSETKHHCVLLSDAKQFCCGFIGNILFDKIASNHIFKTGIFRKKKKNTSWYFDQAA